MALGALALYQNSNFNKRNRIQNRLSIRPYLFTGIEDENISLLAENDVAYYDLEIDDTKITHKGFGRNKPYEIDTYLKYKNEYEQLLCQDDKTIEKQIELLTQQTEILNSLNNRYVLIVYKLANYGNAAAIDVNMLLNNEKFTPLFCISKDSSMMFYFLCDFEKLSINQKKEFAFGFTYYDIEGFGPYTQTELIYINKLENGFLQLNFIDQISKPE